MQFGTVPASSFAVVSDTTIPAVAPALDFGRYHVTVPVRAGAAAPAGRERAGAALGSDRRDPGQFPGRDTAKRGRQRRRPAGLAGAGRGGAPGCGGNLATGVDAPPPRPDRRGESRGSTARTGVRRSAGVGRSS